jgi:hypothetical protein
MHRQADFWQQKNVDRQTLMASPIEVFIDRLRWMVVHDTLRFTDWYDLWPRRDGRFNEARNLYAAFSQLSHTPLSRFSEIKGLGDSA